MGRQSNIKLKGTVENIIYYETGGDYRMRSKPVEVNQSPASIASSHLFGQASKLEKAFRNMMGPAMPFKDDFEQQGRFRGAINQWLHSSTGKSATTVIRPLNTTWYEFNEDSLLAERLQLQISIHSVDKKRIVLTIPAFQPQQSIVAPAHTKKISFTIAAASCKYDNISQQDHSSTELEFPYSNNLVAAQQVILPLRVLPGTVTAIAVRMEYYGGADGNSKTKNKRWMPAAVLTVLDNR